MRKFHYLGDRTPFPEGRDSIACESVEERFGLGDVAFIPNNELHRINWVKDRGLDSFAQY
ncbi:MAG: hypothetical protein QXW19_00480 [Candidatus Bathyarchaeia archaeon]